MLDCYENLSELFIFISHASNGTEYLPLVGWVIHNIHSQTNIQHGIFQGD